MASVTQQIFNAAEGAATVSVTFNDANGAISQLSWTVARGTVTVAVKQGGKPDITITRTSSGSQNVPAGYNLTQNPKDGSWAWTGALEYAISWSP